MKALKLSLCLAAAVLCAQVALGQHVLLGPADNLAIDQPRVAVLAYDPGPPEKSVGPEFFNTWLLDTAAQGLMADYKGSEDMKECGLQLSGVVYNELGVAGYEPFDLSEPYNFLFAGTNGTPYELTDVRIMTTDNLSVNFGGFSGIVGMPAMLNRVTTLDNTAMVSNSSGEMNYMGVSFHTSLPASNGHRYSVPLTMVDYPPTGQINPDDPLPTYAPLPVANVQLSAGGQTTATSLVVDTGAQLSLLSSAVAIELGLDLDNPLDWTSVGGVGGSITAPIFQIDRMAIPTDQGVDMVLTDLLVIIVDIEGIDGILACDILTSGWAIPVMNFQLFGDAEGAGYFNQVHFDFTDFANMRGSMVLDLNGDYDVVVPEPATLAIFGAASLVAIRGRRRNSR